jgi:DNA uptake protein ComE-like DNA-binding protein
MAPVNINKASAETLTFLKYVGTITANLIIAGRPYRDIHEISKVKGIGTVKMKHFVDTGSIYV